MPGPRASVLVVRNRVGEVLFLRRAPYLRHFPDSDSLPGGKAEGDEDELTTLLREVKEETGREYTEEDVVFLGVEHADMGDGVQQSITVYRVDEEDRWEPTLSSEHTGYSWAHPRDALASGTLAGPMTRRILTVLAYPS